MHNCRFCDVTLDDSNWAPSYKARSSMICKSCKSKQNKNTNPKNNPRNNPDRRFIKNDEGKFVYARKSIHPNLYISHPPGYYTVDERGWYTKVSDLEVDSKKSKNLEGHIYIAINPAWPDMLKIGMTDDLERRKSSLNTSVPYRDTTYAYTVEVKDMQKAERLAHKLAEEVCSFRMGEWFRISVDKAKKILDNLESDNIKFIQGSFWPDTDAA